MILYSDLRLIEHPQNEKKYSFTDIRHSKKKKINGCFQFMIWSTNATSSIKNKYNIYKIKAKPERWLIPWCICICSDPVHVTWQRSRCLSVRLSLAVAWQRWRLITFWAALKSTLCKKILTFIPALFYNLHIQLNRKTSKIGFVIK